MNHPAKPLKTRALLVHVHFKTRHAQEHLDECKDLAAAAGAVTVAVVTATRDASDPRLFVGRGKADEIREQVTATEVQLILVNHDLAPAHQRNLEQHVQCRVLDRTGLILDIFARRARSFEGKLQVELAQLRHLSTRLVRGWTHLERQKGGIGLRGPGEKQLETDRRLIGQRIKLISQRLDKVRRQRGVQRATRRKAAFPLISLVGYTNAGKSTLFNRLTGARATVADQLFATLDPTLRRLDVGGGLSVILADTVGFIRHLPHELVAAFHSTLEETREADLLLHVIDATDPERQAKTEQVNAVLAEIGAGAVPQIEVFNKLDRLEGARPRVEREAGGTVRVWTSAGTGAGRELLTAVIRSQLMTDTVHRFLRLPLSAGRLRARLFEMGAVVDERQHGGEWILEVLVRHSDYARLCQAEGFNPIEVAGARPGP
ncbi:MAG: GTPase HflX [Gammaproteobacteria bacterium]|nr:GTPase HflX [Gammaproteobacteria bacterium]MDJ0890866.1 GTPase HflX [Gammaproteobacteria bacterium]